jgi:hypothetical protein
MKFSLHFAPIFVQAVLHKEFVGAKSDKLLGVGRPSGLGLGVPLQPASKRRTVAL